MPGYSYTGGTYFQDFDNVSFSASASTFTTPGVTITQSGGSTDVTEGIASEIVTLGTPVVTLPPGAISLNTPYSQNFDTLNSSGTVTWTDNSTIAGWYTARTGTGTTIVASNGSSNAGNLYSFGSTGSTDRALGSIGSGNSAAGSFYWGARFFNETGNVIDKLYISYVGEEWRNSGAGAQTVEFQYQIGATSLTGGTWVDANNLDFTSPTTGGTAGAINGNASANRSLISSTISGLSLAPGQEIWLRWVDVDHSGSDHGLAIDDLQVSTSPLPAVTIAESNGSTNVTEGGVTDTYTVVLNTQPTANVTITITPDSQTTTSATTLTFTPTNWNVTQTVTATAVDDRNVEGTHSSTITHTATSNDPNYNGIRIATVTATVNDNDVATVITKIHDIQGNGATFNTAFGGTQTIEGIVTRAFLGTSQLNGFYVQEEDGDADSDSTTSEAIFVYDPTGLFTGNVGDTVRVTGTVGEYTSSSSGVTSSLTQLSSLTSVVNLGANVLPTVTNIQLPVTSVADLERYEGMLVDVSAGTGSLTVTEHFQLGRFGQVLLSATGATNQPGTDARLEQYTQFNAPSVSGYAAYLAEIAKREIILDDGSTTQNPDPILFARNGQPLSASNTLRGGDTVDSITGILDQRFEGYRIQTSTGVNFTGTNPRPDTPPNVGGTLKVASFNVLNYFNDLDTGSNITTNGLTFEPRGAETAAEFTRQRDKIIQAIINSGADVMGLMEMENNGYSSNSAIQNLVNGLNAIGGAGTYSFINPGFRLGTDAINVALIYKPGQVTPVGAAATMADGYGTGAFDLVGRKPLAQTFQQNSNSEQFTVVVNHFKSKGSSSGGVGDDDIGDGQGFSNGTRTRQAQDLAAWLATNPTGTTDSDYLIIGDLNAYAQEDPLTTLASAGYKNLLPNTSYSYVFDGQWGSLDHALANSSLAAQVTGAEKWHINSDEPNVLDYNTNFKSVGQQTSLYNPDQYRASDHDPVIIGLNLLSALPTISINNPSVTEGSSGTTPLAFTVSLDKASHLPVTVNYATVNGTAYSGYDYTATSGTLTFAAGQTTKVVNVNVIGDLYNESNETFKLQLSNPSNATINTSYGTGTIIDDDAAPSLSISNISVAEGNSGTRFATFNVSLSTVSGQIVTVNYATADGTATVANNDYTPTSGTLTFAPGNTLLSVNVPIVGDTQVESDKSFYLNLSNVSGATLANNQGVGTILDDDAVASVALTGTSGKDSLTGGDGDNNIFGLDGDDTINGGAGNDNITGGLGADVLTGGSGADRFIYNNFNESLFANSDRIRDFNPGQGDRFILNNLPSAVFNAGIINSNNLSNAVIAAYSDADPTVPGSQVLAANQAVFFSFGNSAATRRTYLSVNDNTSGFNASSDLFIEVTGLVGTLPPGTLTTTNYFAI